MTEYEAASLALRLAAVWVAGLVGAAQCIVAGYGLAVLHRDYNRRAEQHGKNMKETERRIKSRADKHRVNMAAIKARREAQSEQHRENMAALRELIRRTSAPSAQGDG